MAKSRTPEPRSPTGIGEAARSASREATEWGGNALMRQASLSTMSAT